MQKSIKACSESIILAGFVNAPENAKGINTNPFLIHCLGRISFSKPISMELIDLDVTVEGMYLLLSESVWLVLVY